MNTSSLLSHPFIPALLTVPLLLAPQAVGAGGGQTPPDSGHTAKLLYLDQSAGPAIAGYANRKGAETQARAPQIIYADQAYGQAIYSYPHVAPYLKTSFNAQYVDTAYGQAIYSYPSAGSPRGIVKVMDILPLPPAR